MKVSGNEPGDDSSPSARAGARPLPRRATLRPEIRAALALEEAGELQEAARVFEYAGEHAQAAVLRMEHARTLADGGERLDVLREGCARNPGSTAEGRALHLALSETLLDAASGETDPSRRRSLELEAARGLEEAGEGGRAGELYEALGLLDRAARAYERGGEIARLELVLAIIERREEEQARLADLEVEVDRAMAEGQRRQVRVLIDEHVALRERTGRAIAPSLARRSSALEDARPRGDRVRLRWNDDHITTIRGSRTFRIGRSPDSDLVVARARLSRHHVELSIDTSGEQGPRLVAMDLGSKVGTFWDGVPLEPGIAEPLTERGQLALGMGDEIDIAPLSARDSTVCGALVGVPGTEREWVLYLPAGGPLTLAPGIRVPARVLFDRDWIVLDFASGVVADLGPVRLAAGESLELLVGDRLRLRDAPLSMEVLTS